MGKHTIYELRAIMKDTKAERLGAMNVAFKIRELDILSMLTHNSETWTNIPKKAMKILNDIFNQVLRIIFRIGTGRPNANFYW